MALPRVDPRLHGHESLFLLAVVPSPPRSDFIDQGTRAGCRTCLCAASAMSSSSGLRRERFEAQPLAIGGDVASSPRSLRNDDVGSCYDVFGAVLATTPRSHPHWTSRSQTNPHPNPDITPSTYETYLARNQPGELVHSRAASEPALAETQPYQVRRPLTVTPVFRKQEEVLPLAVRFFILGLRLISPRYLPRQLLH